MCCPGGLLSAGQFDFLAGWFACQTWWRMSPILSSSSLRGMSSTHQNPHWQAGETTFNESGLEVSKGQVVLFWKAPTKGTLPASFNRSEWSNASLDLGWSFVSAHILSHYPCFSTCRSLAFRSTHGSLRSTIRFSGFLPTFAFFLQVHDFSCTNLPHCTV